MKNKIHTITLSILILFLVLLMVSCVSQFDSSLLRPNEYSLSPKLPKLAVDGANAVAIGASNQVESSSMLYTIFRREVEKNICENIGIPKGSIQLELIYHDVVQNPGVTNKNLATLEFEVRIFDLDGNNIWSNIYSGTLNDRDNNVAWGFYYSEPAANNATAKLAHQLVDSLKSDIEKDYLAIAEYL